MTDQASVVSSLFPVAKSGLFTSRSHASVWDRKLKDTLDAVKSIGETIRENQAKMVRLDQFMGEQAEAVGFSETIDNLVGWWGGAAI